MKIILASASPRRKELLSQIGMEFVVVPAQGEEIITKEKPREVVVELAEGKAEEVWERMSKEDTNGDLLVIGADTVVVCDDNILGKPKDEADAKRTLAMLSDRTHEVYTGVCLKLRVAGRQINKSFYEATQVTMYPIREEEIEAYVAGGEPADKAGAYGIQGMGAKFVRKINGDYNNVVGLPIARIYQELMQLGIAISWKS